MSITCNIYNVSGRVVSDIEKHEPKASGCISDTTRTLMLYIAYAVAPAGLKNWGGGAKWRGLRGYATPGKF